MKTILRAILVALFPAICGVCAMQARTVESIGRGWLFVRGDSAVYAHPSFDASGWERVNLPHDYQISQPWVPPGADEKADLSNAVANVKSRLSARGFKEPGPAWYRRSFPTDTAWRGRRVLLDFGGIMLTGDVWLNGHKLGGTDYGYLGFEIDITPYLSEEGDNVIAVRADTGSPENSRWYTGGGLYRDVKLVTTDRELYFTRHPLQITTPVVTDSLATVVIRAEITNRLKADPMRVQLSISDADGDEVYARDCDVAFIRRTRTNEYMVDSVVVTLPRLWDTETPHLYTARLALIDPSGRERDVVEQKFGIRSIEYSPDFGFRLNGRKVLLKGIANHHTLGALGAATYPRAIEKRLRLLKEFGFNHVRTSHNPYSEEFLDLCDEYGILVVDELYDKWLKQYAGGRRDWTEQWQHDVPEWVKRDRNHPSVVMWSLGNELQLLWDIPFADWGVTPYRLQKTLLNRYDTTRPITVAMHPRGRSLDSDSIPAPLALETDIASYNYRYMYFPGDSRRYPWMIFYQSEANNSGMGPNYYEMDLDRVVGLAYWGMIDYLGESHGWPAKGWAQGVFDISLRPKPNAWFLRSIFLPDEPVVHIGVIDAADNTVWNDVQVGTESLSDHWNRREGSEVDLYTFTNADEVELLLNGRTIGRQRNDKTDPKTRNRIRWQRLPYKPGQLEARAYSDGQKKPVAIHSIRTAGKARSLSLVPDTISWRADGSDLMYVDVFAVDSKGTIDPAEDGEVTFTVDGPAEIVGVANGDMTSSESLTGCRRSLWRGAVSVILRADTIPGSITLSARHPRLGTKSITLPTK